MTSPRSKFLGESAARAKKLIALVTAADGMTSLWLLAGRVITQ